MEIAVGAKVLLDLGGTEPRRVTGRLIGWKTLESILVSIPLFVGIRDYTEIGRYITCRYMHEGTVYGFKSHIQGYTSNPESIVFLSYPESWESIELRQQTRLPCFFPASFQISGYEALGILNDISEMGCRVSCGPSREDVLDHITLGAETIIRFFPFGGQTGCNIPALIVNASTDDKRITGIGFKFPHLDEDFRERLKAHILRVQECSI